MTIHIYSSTIALYLITSTLTLYRLCFALDTLKYRASTLLVQKTMKKTTVINSKAEALEALKTAKQTADSKKQTADKKQTAEQTARQFITALADVKQYNIVLDVDIADDRHTRTDYIHIYRHDTQFASQYAHNNVFQCYLKHSKKQVYILANKINFEAFTTSIQYKKQYKNTSIIRFIVAYDNFTAFMHDLAQYDSDRQKQTATATAEAQQTAKAK